MLVIAKNPSIPPLSALFGIGACVIALVIIFWAADYLMAWLARNVFRWTFGFPAIYQISKTESDDRHLRWFSLGTSNVGSLVTNKACYAAADEGLAFKVRSVFGYGLMEAVLIPWSAMRQEWTPGRLFNVPSLKLHIVDDAARNMLTIETGLNHREWNNLMKRVPHWEGTMCLHRDMKTTECQ